MHVVAIGASAIRSVQQLCVAKRLTEYFRASNSSLSASRSTASCSSPKLFRQAVAEQEAVRTCKERRMHESR